MPERACEFCGQTFRYKASREGRARFCSQSCRATFVGRATAARRGDVQRDRGRGKTYRKVGGRHEHRIIAEAMIRRPLLKDEVVHHIDRNVRNNDPSNLMILTRSEHMREHGIGIPGAKLPWKPWEHRK